MVKKTYENGDVYEGNINSDNEPHGYGVINYADDTLFQGEWSNGKITSGKMTFPDGVTYEGEFKDDLRNGKGIVKLADNTVNYSGMWKNNLNNGFGMAIFEESKYIGNWKNGEIKGEGKYIFEVATFIGTWENSTTGYGTIQYTNGDFYEGEWVDYKKHGKGTIQYITKDLYEGEWKDDEKSGNGKMTFASGVVYDGRWLYNQPFVNADGNLIIDDVVLRCKWDENFLIREILQIKNPNKKIISIADIVPFLNSRMTYTPSFYSLIGLYSSSDEIENFKTKMLTYTGTVMIGAVCHGVIFPPIPLPIQNLHRISKVVNGVCGFGTIYDNLFVVDTCISNGPSTIIPIINKQFQQTLKTQCNEPPCNYREESEQYFKMFHNVRGLVESPQKLAKIGNLIFNKEFTSYGPNINVLLLIDEEGNYINLFSEKDTYRLEELFAMIPQCSKCILLDHSCSGPGKNEETDEYYTFTKQELESYGGTRKKRKKIKRTRKK